MTEEKAKKEVVKKAKAEVAVIDYAEVQGTQYDQDDTTTPFLKLLQKTSPEIEEDTSNYIPGAKVGMFLNTSTKPVFDSPIVVIPCGYSRQFLEWVPRDAGGGFKGEVAKEFALGLERDDRGRYLHSNGNYILDTRVHYVLHVVDGELQPAVMSLKSSAIKRSKELNDLISTIRIEDASGKKFRPADFSHTYIVEVTHEQKDQDTWKLPRFSKGEQVTDAAVWNTAKEFAAIIRQGAVKVDQTQADTASSSTVQEATDF